MSMDWPQCDNCGSTKGPFSTINTLDYCPKCAGDIMASKAAKNRELVQTQFMTKSQNKALKKAHPKYKFSNFIRNKFNKQRLDGKGKDV